jgi:hypothetical protein
MTNADVQKIIDALSDRSRFIEAGWISLRAEAIPVGASAAHVEDMRKTFYAGACHLFGCLGACIDAEFDDDETPRVVFEEVMQAVSNELDQFHDLIVLEASEVAGHA